LPRSNQQPTSDGIFFISPLDKLILAAKVLIQFVEQDKALSVTRKVLCRNAKYFLKFFEGSSIYKRKWT